MDDEVTFVADGLTIYGTYRHRADSPPGPAALLISESGNTDRNGDNAVAGKIGTLRAIAGLLSDRGVASLRYDKVGTGRTGLGPYASRPSMSAARYTPRGQRQLCGSWPAKQARTRTESRCTATARARLTR